MTTAQAPANAGSAQTGELSSDQLTVGIKLLAITTLAMTMAMNVTQAIGPNFFRDEIGLNGALNGYLIAIRELPGFLLIFVAALLLRQGLARATSISLFIAGVGFILFSTSSSFLTLIIPTLVSSIGYHSWLQLQDALGLSLAQPGREGSVLGRFRSIGFAGTMIALIATLVILLYVERTTGDLRANQGPWLRGLYVASGVLAFFGAVAIFRFPISARDQAVARAAPRITWRKEYKLYYWLAFLDGSRQQIYFAFAPFVLVEQFKVDAGTLTTLLIISALINWASGSRIGKLVDRYGEKKILTIGYAIHFFVFLGFALSQNIYLLYFTYLVYNFLFLFSIGTTTYLRKICRREDLAPSLAMGISLSHLTAIVVPIVGSMLWARLGYQFPFLFGTVFVVASVILTQKINVPAQRVAGAPGTLPPHEAEREMTADAQTLEMDADGQLVSPAAIAALADEDAETNSKDTSR